MSLFKLINGIMLLAVLSACGGGGGGDATAAGQDPGEQDPTVQDPDSEAPNGVLTTAYTYTADLGSTSATPKQSLVSYLASDKSIHLAWVEQAAADDQRLKYGVLSPENIFTKYDISHDTQGLVFAIAMVVDDNNKAHIVMHTKRDKSVSCCKSGNHALYYSSNISGVFATQQVSDNPVVPTDNTQTRYDAYVNGRPDVFLDAAGAPNILFTADGNSLTSYDDYAVLATKSGGGWSKSQLFNVDDFNGTYSADHELFVSRNSTSSGPFVWNDIGDYNIHAVQSGVDNELTGYGGYLDLKDVQAIDDGNGTTYAVWLREDSATEDYAFYISKILTSGLDTPVRIEIDSTSTTSNFAPASIDPITGHFYLMYTEGAFSSVTDRHLVVYKPSNGTHKEVTLPEDIGTPYGHDSLWVYDGDLSYVSADSWAAIKINRWNNVLESIDFE